LSELNNGKSKGGVMEGNKPTPRGVTYKGYLGGKDAGVKHEDKIKNCQIKKVEHPRGRRNFSESQESNRGIPRRKGGHGGLVLQQKSL